MKKSDQIKALQAECDRLAVERDAYRKALADAAREVDRLRRAVESPSLVDQARSEFRAKWSWLLEAVGL